MALWMAYGCSNGDVMRFTKHGICMAGVFGAGEMIIYGWHGFDLL